MIIRKPTTNRCNKESIKISYRGYLFSFPFGISTVVLESYCFFVFFYTYKAVLCICVGCMGIWVVKWTQVPNDTPVGRG